MYNNRPQKTLTRHPPNTSTNETRSRAGIYPQRLDAVYTQNRAVREKDEAIDRPDKEIAQLKQDKVALQRENAELLQTLSAIWGML